MDSNPNSSPVENNESKAMFRKPSNDVANRKYRHRSPASSSSSDGSPIREQSGSPVPLREDGKSSSYLTKKSDNTNDKISRSLQHPSSESHRYSSRRSYGSSRHDDSRKDGKHSNEDDKHRRVSSRSSRDHRGGSHSDYRGQDADFKRSRDNYRDCDKHACDMSDIMAHPGRERERHTQAENSRKYRYKDSPSDKRHAKLNTEEVSPDDRDKSTKDREYRDDKRDNRSSRDYRIDHTTSYGESREHRGHAASKRDSHGYHSRETYKDEHRNFRSRDDNQKDVEQDIDSTKMHAEVSGGRIETGSDVKESEEFMTKKPRVSGFDKNPTQIEDDSKPGEQPVGKAAAGQALVSNSEAAINVDAAKVAAMRAAELVNKNLMGTGFMTADQKKKLLWGNKKTSTSEEHSSHWWDSAAFSEHERQKFNKFIGVKGDAKLEQRTGNQDTDLAQAEKQKELQLDLEKQYTAGLRRRDGRTVGLGL